MNDTITSYALDASQLPGAIDSLGTIFGVAAVSLFLVGDLIFNGGQLTAGPLLRLSRSIKARAAR